MGEDDCAYRARLRSGPTEQSKGAMSTAEAVVDQNSDASPICYTPSTPTPSKLIGEVRTMWREAVTPCKKLVADDLDAELFIDTVSDVTLVQAVEDLSILSENNTDETAPPTDPTND